MAVTLETALAERRGVAPGFNMLRHALAFSILLFHCYLAVRFHADATGPAHPAAIVNNPQLAGSSKAMDWARPVLFALVGAFFALSGFLVMGSAVRTRSLVTFFANRALRILPALAVEVTLSALILGPLVTTDRLSAYYADPLFPRYFWNILGHIQFLLPGVFMSNPWPGTVNLNLWTLPAELYSYLFMLILMGTGIAFSLRWSRLTLALVVGIMILAALLLPAVLPVKANTTHFTAWYIMLMFVVGAAFFCNREWIVVDGRLFIISLVVYYGIVRFDIVTPFACLPLTYCVVYVGMCRFEAFDRLMRMDLSYGIYLYGFPITQTVVLVLAPTLLRMHSTGLRVLVTGSIVTMLTGLFSAASWLGIEKRALRLRRLLVPAKRSSELPAGEAIAVDLARSG